MHQDPFLEADVVFIHAGASSGETARVLSVDAEKRTCQVGVRCGDEELLTEVAWDHLCLLEPGRRPPLPDFLAAVRSSMERTVAVTGEVWWAAQAAEPIPDAPEQLRALASLFRFLVTSWTTNAWEEIERRHEAVRSRMNSLSEEEQRTVWMREYRAFTGGQEAVDAQFQHLLASRPVARSAAAEAADFGGRILFGFSAHERLEGLLKAGARLRDRCVKASSPAEEVAVVPANAVDARQVFCALA